MEKIIMNRGYGKTYQLIKKSAETNNYIVCHNKEEACRIQSIANEFKVKIPFPITYYEFINNRYYAKGITGFLIDNAEMLLQAMTNIPINAITITH